MLRWRRRAACLALVMQITSTAFAQTTVKDVPVPPVKDLPVPPVEVRTEAADEEASAWIDRAHRNLHSVLWRASMNVDRWFGAEMPEHSYADQTRGSITPLVLWDEFNGLDQKFRFRVKMPLPYLGDRYDAFVGTFTRDEFVTERDQASGAIPRQRVGGQVEEDETLVGITYREKKEGGRFEADAGIRIRSPIDPFVKGGYRYSKLMDGGTRLTLRETAFWQNSEEFGITSRVDVERVVSDDWLVRWTGSGTISQESEGVRGYTAFTVYKSLQSNRAVAGQVFTSGEFDAAVPLGEYGIRAAYRQSIVREWLVLEVRPSLTFPKDDPDDTRKASWGIGIALEMFFGMDEFQARPATF
jgi:hypothetical protein